MVDASKYAPKRITPDAVRDSAITTTIIEVLEDERFDRLILETGIGAQFGLNAGNTNTLIKAFGRDTDGWLGREITLELGHYTDGKTGEDRETVRVRTAPSGTPAQNGGAPANKPLPPSKVATSLRDDFSDDIPF